MWQLTGVVLCVVVAVRGDAALPEGIKLCKKSDANLNDCVKEAIQSTLEKFGGGVPSLDIESLDPFYIGNLILDKKKFNGSPVDIDLSWNDAYITGIQSAVLSSAKVDWDNNMISFEATLSKPLDIKGKYSMDGVVLILPIKGSGDFDCKLEGFQAHIKIHGVPKDVDGKKYMMIERLVFTFETKHMTVEYKDLFGGDPTLGATMNAFLNENWRDIVDELKPAIEAALSSHFQPIAEKVFNVIPIDQIALP